jgi:glycosyltransferase involved in cell wall biosynthesis
MGIGKTGIATQTTGTVDYLDSGVNGILVPVGDHRARRRAIDSLISDPDLYRKLAENALATIRKRHTFDIYVENILLVAEELAASNRR